jgi:RNA polymerase-binding transcription factor
MDKKTSTSGRYEFLDGVREHLLETKSKLLEEMDTDQKAQRDANKDEGMDAYDLASEERDREINFILSDRERAKIKEIDDALARLADQSYGVCEECGLEIGEERLEALPFTRVCRDCQQDREREAKSQRNFDGEDRAYRKVGSTDGDEDNM